MTPSWINVAVPSRPLGQLPVVELADVAPLGLRRCYERLEAGEHPAFVQDAVALARLAWQIERDEAIPARDKALAELAEIQAAVLSLKGAIIRRSRAGRMAGIVGEVQKEREKTRAIQRARQRFATVSRRVR